MVNHNNPPTGRASLAAPKGGKKVIEVCPHGDRVFVVGSGEEQTKIRISSGIVGKASPAFAAMFTHGFKETNMSEIPLPEDDPVAATELFHIIHDWNYQSCWDTKGLLEIAIMADKWMCVEAIKPWFQRQASDIEWTLNEHCQWHGVEVVSFKTPEQSERFISKVSERNNVESRWWSVSSDWFRSTVKEVDIREAVLITALLRSDGMLFYSSRLALARSGAREEEIFSEQLASRRGNLPRIDTSIIALIGKESRKHTASFIKAVDTAIRSTLCSKCIANNCPRGVYPKEAIEFFLRTEGIELSKEGAAGCEVSVKKAIESVGKLLYSLHEDYSFKRISALKCDRGCDCSGDRKECDKWWWRLELELRPLLKTHVEKLPGICGTHYAQNGSNCFMVTDCWEHQDRQEGLTHIDRDPQHQYVAPLLMPVKP